MTNHSYLLQEGKWIGKGFFIDNNNDSYPFKGTMVTIHREHEWIHESTMKILLKGNTIEIHNNLSIVPFKDNIDYTIWESKNPDIGKLHGEFIIVHDSILSSCVSADSSFHGSEFFSKIDDMTYINRGTLTKRRQKISSWVMELTKLE